MVVHSEMAKKIGTAAAVFGVALIVIAGILLVPTQHSTLSIPLYGTILFAVFLGYAISVGVYFIVAGVLVWIVGAAIEWKAQKNEDTDPQVKQ